MTYEPETVTCTCCLRQQELVADGAVPKDLGVFVNAAPARVFGPGLLANTGLTNALIEIGRLNKRIAMLEAERGPGMKAPQPVITCDLGVDYE